MSVRAPRLIVVEDLESDFLLLKRKLTEIYPEVVCRHVTNRDELVSALGEVDWDAALCDFTVPGLDFSECQDLIVAHSRDLPLVLVSGSVGEERAVELITGGVRDFVLKDNLKRLAPALKRVLDEAEEKRARFRAEEALRESEARYRALVETAFDWIWEVDTAGRYCYASPRVEVILGYTPKEIIGRTPFDFMTPAEAIRLSEVFNDAAAKREPFSNLLNANLARDGHIVMLESSGAPLIGAGGELLGYRGCDRDVTERLRAEAQRNEIGRHMEFVLGASKTGLDIIDSRFALRYVDPAWQKVYGDPTGKTCFDYFQGAKRACTECGLPEAFRTKMPVTREETLPLEGNRVVQVTTIPFQDEEGEWLAAEVNVDITERRRMEDALRESELRYRLLAENISDVIWILDLDTLRFRYVSSSARSLLGVSAEEAMQRGFNAFFADGQATVLAERMRSRAEEFSRGTVLSYVDEIDQPRGDGTLVATEITTRYVLDPATGHREIFGVSRDISQRRVAQEALRQSEEHYRAMIMNAPYGVLTADANGTLLSANPALARMMGFDSPQQLLSESDGDELARFLKDHPPVAEMLSGPPSEKETWRRVENMHFVRRDGTPALINLEVRMFRSQRTGRYELEGFVEDVTEKKRAEQERQTLLEQMRQSQKMEAVGKLAGGIAHDFNNLLTVIGGYSEFALARTAPGTPLRSALTEITAAAKRAGALTSQLLAFSRNQILAPKIVDLAALIAGVAEMLRRLLGEDVELQVKGSSSLWPVLVDPGKIEQVIMNLAVNGRDAMPSGGVLTITTTNFGLEAADREAFPEAKGDYVVLTIRDTGVGMDAVTRERIFEPFFTTKEKGKGTGLGLAIVYGIVKQSGGHIRCDSEPGNGAQFKILLPRSHEEQKAATIVAPAAERSEGGTETILLVEDDETVRSFSALVLRAAGYTVVEAIDGPGALSLASENAGEIHLIICDVVMPRMDGPAVIRALKPILGEIPYLFMSGYSQTELSRRGVLGPGMKLLHKPFTSIGLKQIVRAAIDSSR